jgi:hypothetical protein
MGVETISVIVVAAWIAVFVVVVAMCRAAAHADAQTERLIAHADRRIAHDRLIAHSERLIAH